MTVTLDMQDSVAVITIDDGKKNAITHDILGRLEQALDTAEAEAGAVVLAGRPGSFCAGFDLATMTGSDPEAARALGGRGGALAVRLFGFPKPLVAACTGHAFTIGAIWLACCDTRIGEEGPFKFGMRETVLGMVLPDWAVLPLKERLSQAHFLAAVTQSQTFDPQGAREAGFLDRLVPAGRAVAQACALAAELAQLPGDAYAGNKLSTRGDVLDRMRASLSAR